MNLLIITPLYPPALGGAATYFKQLAPCLVEHDEITQLTVLTERMPGQPQVQGDGKLRLLRRLPNRISSGQKSFVLHSATYILTQLWFAINLRALVRNYAVDIVHFHTRYRGRWFYHALRALPVPVVADLRDKLSDPAQLAEVADCVLCCGDGVYAFALAGGCPPAQAALIPNLFMPPPLPAPEAVTLCKRRYKLEDHPYLLFIGDITYNKGVYDLLEAYRGWQKHHPDTRLVLAGVNQEGTRFLNQVQQTPGASYLGRISHADVLCLMRGAEMVVLPSRSEGLPTVILEAIAMETKVICPPGIPEFERHLPNFVLPEVSTPAILEMFNKVWTYPYRPTYPFAEHHIHRVGEALIRLYTSLG
ncbi:MAG: glycosyltransferase family 4 protein [Anaerolineae bacterium]